MFLLSRQLYGNRGYCYIISDCCHILMLNPSHMDFMTLLRTTLYCRNTMVQHINSSQINSLSLSQYTAHQQFTNQLSLSLSQYTAHQQFTNQLSLSLNIQHINSSQINSLSLSLSIYSTSTVHKSTLSLSLNIQHINSSQINSLSIYSTSTVHKSTLSQYTAHQQFTNQLSLSQYTAHPQFTNQLSLNIQHINSSQINSLSLSQYTAHQQFTNQLSLTLNIYVTRSHEIGLKLHHAVPGISLKTVVGDNLGEIEIFALCRSSVIFTPYTCSFLIVFDP